MRRLLVICCILLTACGSSSPTPTAPGKEARLPTRLPTATPTAVILSAETYYERGVERQRAGDRHWAGRYFSWAIRRDAAFAPAYVSRASLYLAEDDLHPALRDVDTALGIEQTAEAYLLRGEILREMGRYERALEAFDQALARDPDLRDEVYQSRWEAAKALQDANCLAALSSEYAAAHGGDWLRHYYTAWGAFVSENHKEAITILVEGIEDSGEQPALLWYLLGRAYMGIGAWQEAMLSLETARALAQAGDTSMMAHTEQPVGDLFVALGRAYLGAGRCADAETMLAYGLSAGASMSEHLSALEEARNCQMATPSAPADQ